MSELEYRLHSARTHLKGIWAIQNSARGVWSLTEKGQTITPEQMRRDTKAYRDEVLRRAKHKQASNGATDQASNDELDSWKHQLIARLLRLTPHGFE